MGKIEPCFWKVAGCKCSGMPAEVGTKEDEEYCAIAVGFKEKIAKKYSSQINENTKLKA